MNISCLIVDDEPFAGNLLEEYITRIPYLTLQSKCVTALLALDFLRAHEIDLIFLDINLPLLSGMQLAKVLPPNQKVIFTTAYTEYAIESYSVNAVDYLLKPITLERFIQAVEKASVQIKNLSKSGGPVTEEDGNFFIKSGKAMVKIGHDEIHFIEGLKDYVIFQMGGEKHIVYKRMKDLVEILPPQFKRIHQSFIVNVDQIKKIEDNQVHILGRKIPIGEKYREDFILTIKNKLI